MLNKYGMSSLFFFFQAEDGIRDVAVTGVQTCALPICRHDRVLVDVDPVVACAIDRNGALRCVDLDALPFGKVLQVERGMAGCELELEIAGLERGDVELGRGRGADERAAPNGELEMGAIARVERVAGSERHVDARGCPVVGTGAPERNLTLDERQARGRR